eukprot:353947-Chlamydomonas_euryale.AAC.2
MLACLRACVRACMNWLVARMTRSSARCGGSACCCATLSGVRLRLTAGDAVDPRADLVNGALCNDCELAADDVEVVASGKASEHVSSFPFCTWRSLRWGMSGMTPSDPDGWRRLRCPELKLHTHVVSCRVGCELVCVRAATFALQPWVRACWSQKCGTPRDGCAREDLSKMSGQQHKAVL